MSDECIHGFENGLCAICNPKPAAEPAAGARSATRVRAAAAPKSLARVTRAGARVAAGPAPAEALLEQRIYHLTHLSNLSGIITDGAIVAGATAELELSPTELRAERGDIEIPGSNDKHLIDYVPFFLSPEADLWQRLRRRQGHPRLSGAARAADTLDFVFLITTVRQIIGTEAAFVLADGNVEGDTTRFATTREDAERMLGRLRALSDDTTLKNAELLVAESVPLEAVTLVGVANDRVRQSVRELLAGATTSPKISVYPPWFQQPV